MASPEPSFPPPLASAAPGAAGAPPWAALPEAGGGGGTGSAAMRFRAKIVDLACLNNFSRECVGLGGASASLTRRGGGGRAVCAGPFVGALRPRPWLHPAEGGGGGQREVAFFPLIPSAFLGFSGIRCDFGD